MSLTINVTSDPKETLGGHGEILHRLFDISRKLDQIMSAVSDFAKAQNDFNRRDQAAVVALQATLKTMNDLIATLQSTPGPISAEDQATLDQLQATGGTLTSSLESLAGTVPPTPPTA